MQQTQQVQSRVQELFDDGFITSDAGGPYRVVVDPEEQDRIRSIKGSKMHKPDGAGSQVPASQQQSFQSVDDQDDEEQYENSMHM